MLSKALLLCAALAAAAPAQVLTTIYSFDQTDGGQPNGLIQATSGYLYGTTLYGGNCDAELGCGTIFKVTPSGTLTTLYNFCAKGNCLDTNISPEGTLVQAANGDFYGITQQGSDNCSNTSICGTIFRITPTGTFTTIYNFCSSTGCKQGDGSYGGLVAGPDGDFYGTTASGGNRNNAGTVFKITPAGAFTTLYRFCSAGGSCADGTSPYGGLTLGTDGNFYGTTKSGGPNGGGTIFKITPGGALTTLHTFCTVSGCPDGSDVAAGLIQATDGDFYGTTVEGGTTNSGTVFKITAAGQLTTLYSFCTQTGCTDGYQPEAALVQATDGNLYGSTQFGGVPCDSVDNGEGCGTLFRITPSGNLTTIYTFCSETNCADGIFPHAALMQDTDGDLYGSVSEGGPNGNYGNLFRVSLGVGPFVKAQTSSGAVGSTVKILGTGLTGATSVRFHGTSATFTVVSGSLITATVPAGATSGTIQVVTSYGTLSSNVVFTVTP